MILVLFKVMIKVKGKTDYWKFLNHKKKKMKENPKSKIR